MEQTRRFIESAIEHAAQVPRRDYELAVVEVETGDVIGGCELQTRRWEYAEFEIGYQLAKRHWGKGIAQEVVRALTIFGFEQANAHRIFAFVDPENPRSVGVLESNEYRQEGHLRRDCLIDGRWCDSLIFARLNDDWRPS